MTGTATLLSEQLDTLIEEETQTFVRRQPESRAFTARAATPRRRRHVELADRRAAGGVDQPRSRLEDLRRRRVRVLRLPRRVRRLAGRPRASRDRGGGPGPGGQGHPLRAADRGRDHRRGQPRRPVRAAAVAVRQLRHRGDHGRRPPDARGHRSRPDPEGRGLLPRPPRLGAGLGAARARRRHRAARPAGRRTRQHRHPAGDHGPGDGRTVQRPGGRRARTPGAPGPGGGDDPRADHDERRDHPPRGRLSRGA